MHKNRVAVFILALMMFAQQAEAGELLIKAEKGAAEKELLAKETADALKLKQTAQQDALRAQETQNLIKQTQRGSELAARQRALAEQEKLAEMEKTQLAKEKAAQATKAAKEGGLARSAPRKVSTPAANLLEKQKAALADLQKAHEAQTAIEDAALAAKREEAAALQTKVKVAEEQEALAKAKAAKTMAGKWNSFKEEWSTKSKMGKAWWIATKPIGYVVGGGMAAAMLFLTPSMFDPSLKLEDLYGLISTESDRLSALVTPIQAADSVGTAVALNALHRGDIYDPISSDTDNTVNGKTALQIAKTLRDNADVVPMKGAPSQAQYQVIVNQVSCAGDQQDVSLLDPNSQKPLVDPNTQQPMTVATYCQAANITTEGQKAAREVNVPPLMTAMINHDLNSLNAILAKDQLAQTILTAAYMGTDYPYFTGKTLIQSAQILANVDSLTTYLNSTQAQQPYDYYLSQQYGQILNQLMCYINNPKNGLPASSNLFTQAAPDFNANVCPNIAAAMATANAAAAIAEPMMAQGGLIPKLVDAITNQDSVAIASLAAGSNFHPEIIANIKYLGLDYTIWQDKPKSIIEIAQAYVNAPPYGNTALAPVCQVIVNQLKCLLLSPHDPSIPAGFDCSPAGITKAMTAAQAQASAAAAGGGMPMTSGTAAGASTLSCPYDQTPDPTGATCVCLFGGQTIDPSTGSCVCPAGQTVNSTTFNCTPAKKATSKKSNKPKQKNKPKKGSKGKKKK